MKTNLLPRFIVIILVAIGAALLAWYIPPRLGIDLAGGTSLLYELDTSKLSPNDNVADVAARVIDVLRKRVDPSGQKNIIWRVVGGKRIQIQMPYAPKATQLAQKKRDDAKAALEAVVWRMPAVDGASKLPKDQREQAFEQFAPKGSPEFEKLVKLGEAADRKAKAAEARKALTPEQTAQSEGVLKEYLKATENENTALSEAMASSVDIDELTDLLSAHADNPGDAGIQKQLDDLPLKYPLQKDKIEAYVSAYQAYRTLSGGGVDDPDELKHLVTRAGVLDFRIAVVPSEIGGLNSPEAREAIQSLTQHGAEQQITVGGVKARWFAIDPNGVTNFSPDGYVMAPFGGIMHILCYDDSALNNATPHCLTHSDPGRQPWSVTAKSPYMGPDGALTLPFNLNPVGAVYMGDLTEVNMHHPMAILLDDKAMTAPNINGHISDSGVITFGRATSTHPIEMIKKEADDLKQIMDAGSLPATLQSQPISEQKISSSMGADNIAAGITSAYYAVIAVVTFMVVYYTITGFFADVALMLNLLLVLATMAMFHGTFTLPGIAGLVLTLGMAVDANVLINERIREEVHKGASLWMAIKQGYDKVFWTIFDANLTCSITAIVLYEVGSEDVKGFGLTLLIGLAIHMFTALFVTRTFMMAAVKWGVLRAIDDHSVGEYLREIVTFTWLRNGHFPFMRVITVTKIDWIGKRHIFWGVSAVVIVAGIAVFLLRGEDKYDIEFRGGTQITIQLKKPLTVEEVRHRIQSLADAKNPLHKPELDELADAQVYTVGDPKDDRFEMQTTIRNKPQNFGETLPMPLATALGIDRKDVSIHQDSDATTVRVILGKDATLTAPEVAAKVKALATQAGLSDLAEAEVVAANDAVTPNTFDIEIPNSNIQNTLVKPLAEAFKDVIDVTPQVSIKNEKLEERDLEAAGYIAPIPEGTPSLDKVFTTGDIKDIPAVDVRKFGRGAAILLDDIKSPESAQKFKSRIDTTRRGALFQNVPHREFSVIPISVLDDKGNVVPAGQGLSPAQEETRPMTRAVVVTLDPAHGYDADNESAVALWRSKVASTEWNIVRASLQPGQVFEGVTSFDAVVANQAKLQALLAVLISLVLIVIYVWVRFGGIRYGIGAILSLVHDAIVAMAATVLSGVVYKYVFHQNPYLLITDYKINLTMIAAYLTIIGYSVNDTIVIFDRVRELRGKAHVPLTKKLVNDAINQCFGRTIWTTFTVFIVVLIMYIWGGEGVRGFSFAMLIGVITGAYSTLAIASPMLLSTGTGISSATPRDENPFQRKDDPTHLLNPTAD